MTALHTIYRRCRKVQIDSRACQEGDLFFALQGTRDGNQFARSALDNGAAYAVVDAPELATEDRCLWVPNALKALQDLARTHRQTISFPVLGLTGSNGKTTTKELVARVLAGRFRTYATPGNYNNHIGVPLTVLGIPADTEIAVVEMGANAQGEIALLSSITQPDMGMITNIGKAHLEGFGGPEGVRKGKGELFDFLKHRGGRIFYRADDPILTEMVGEYTPATSYGTVPEAAFRFVLSKMHPTIQLSYTGSSGKQIMVESPLFGPHNAANIQAAIAIGLHYGVSDEAIQQAIAGYSATNNRSQLLRVGSNRFILDAYNANPDSMRHALDSLIHMAGAAKLAILGDMLELGESTMREHEAIRDHLLAHSEIDVILVGPSFGAIDRPGSWQWFPDAAAARTWIDAQEWTDRTILVKGSRGIALERAVTGLLSESGIGPA